MRVLLTLVVAALAGTVSVGQESPRAATAPDPLAAARAIMVAARYCTLVTLAEGGRPQARTMDPFAPEADLTVWLGTNPKSRKVEQIRRDSRVALHYLDLKTQDTVTLYGQAQLVTDANEKRRRWKEEWKAFYPDRDAGYVLIAVTPEQVEILSPARGFPNDPITWQPITIQLPVKKTGS